MLVFTHQKIEYWHIFNDFETDNVLESVEFTSSDSLIEVWIILILINKIESPHPKSLFVRYCATHIFTMKMIFIFANINKLVNFSMINWMSCFFFKFTFKAIARSNAYDASTIQVTTNECATTTDTNHEQPNSSSNQPVSALWRSYRKRYN